MQAITERLQSVQFAVENREEKWRERGGRGGGELGREEFRTRQGYVRKAVFCSRDLAPSVHTLENWPICGTIGPCADYVPEIKPA